MRTYCNKQPLGPRGSLLPCEPKCQRNWSVLPTAPVWSIHNNRNSKTDPEALTHPMARRPLIGWGPPVCALYRSVLNGGKASDWLRPIPCWQEGNNLPKGQYQLGSRYSTRVHLPGHLACDPSSRRKASHVSSQGKEAIFVTHDTLPQVVKASTLYYKNRKTYLQ